MRTLLVCLIAVMCAAAVSAGANSALGKWNCSSVGENGTKLDWSLQVAEQVGQLTAVATLDGTDIPLFDIKIDGDTLTFKLRVNEHEVVSFELHIAGDKLTGRFEGKESGKATITGARA